MIGKHHIEVRNQRVMFNFDLKRNITVIRGDSATGKTTLISMISDYEAYGKESGVKIKCDKPCRVLSSLDWQYRLSAIKDSIVFIDEGNKFIKSIEFAEAVRNSDNYYVLITRESLYNLPYSMEEVYEMKKYRKNTKLQRVYNGLRRFYSDMPISGYQLDEADVIMTEDSNSGFDFFDRIAKEKSMQSMSAGGKSNIFRLLTQMTDKVVVVADGAAFGSEIERIYKLQSTRPGKIVLYLPESFEWLILSSNILNDREVEEILTHPEDYIDSSLYFSWEQYFTSLLSEKTVDTVYMRYTKSQLASFYLQQENIRKIMEKIEQG